MTEIIATYFIQKSYANLTHAQNRDSIICVHLLQCNNPYAICMAVGTAYTPYHLPQMGKMSSQHAMR